MSWPNPFHSLKDLWRAAKGKEKLDFIVFTFVVVDKMPGVHNWRLRWRYEPRGPWVGFIPLTGTQSAVVDEAIEQNHTLTIRWRERDRKVVLPVRHTAGPVQQCPACRLGRDGHVPEERRKW